MLPNYFNRERFEQIHYFVGTSRKFHPLNSRLMLTSNFLGFLLFFFYSKTVSFHVLST